MKYKCKPIVYMEDHIEEMRQYVDSGVAVFGFFRYDKARDKGFFGYLAGIDNNGFFDEDGKFAPIFEPIDESKESIIGFLYENTRLVFAFFVAMAIVVGIGSLVFYILMTIVLPFALLFFVPLSVGLTVWLSVKAVEYHEIIVHDLYGWLI